MTKRAAVLGHPVKHSKSPRLHNHWLRIRGIDAVYERVEPPLDGFEDRVHGLMADGYVGCNVTIPFKEEALSLADYPSELAQKIGAANTLWFKNNKIYADNTDGFGFAQNLLAEIPDWNVKGDHIVLGAGGAARAIVAWLTQKGAKVTIVNRNQERAASLKSLGKEIEIATWDDLHELLIGKTTLINTTSLGMNGENDVKLDFANAHSELVVADIVYTPLQTGLIREARAAGLRSIGGLGMLLWQARPGFEKWFGVEPPSIDSGLENLMLTPQVIGLTGGIGTGKTTVAKMFTEAGFALWDADAEVTAMYQDNTKLNTFVASHAPSAIVDGVIDKAKWRDIVLANKSILQELEKIIHSHIQKSRREFLEMDQSPKILDIPLLFEAELQNQFDKVITVSCAPDIQRERVMARGKMTEEQFETILLRQMTNEEKCARADYVIDTSGSIAETRVQLQTILKEIGYA